MLQCANCGGMLDPAEAARDEASGWRSAPEMELPAAPPPPPVEPGHADDIFEAPASGEDWEVILETDEDAPLPPARSAARQPHAAAPNPSVPTPARTARKPLPAAPRRGWMARLRARFGRRG
jgi:hypothetical protein